MIGVLHGLSTLIGASHPDPMDDIKWVVIVITGWAEAVVMRSKLEFAGIPCLLKREAAGAAFGITIGALGDVRVLTTEPNVKVALELLNEDVSYDILNDENE